MNRKTGLILGSLVVVTLAGAFFGGRAYERNSLHAVGMIRLDGAGNVSSRGGNSAGFGGFRGNVGGTRGGLGGGFAIGTVLSRDDSSVTIRTSDGGSKIVYVSSSTSVSKSVPGSSEDFSSGDRIRINGKNNPDGTVTADSIDILPQDMTTSEGANP